MIDASEFASRRHRLMQAIGDDGIALIPAAGHQTRNSDVHYPFRQNSDFRYLSGFAEPDAWLMLAPGHCIDGKAADFVVFCRPRNPEMELWDGKRHGPEGVESQFGADRGIAVDDMDAQVVAALKGRRRLAFTLGASEAADKRVIGWLNRVRATARREPGAPTEIISLEPLVHEQRLIKSPGEVAVMQHASSVSAAAHCRAMQACKPGKFEYEIAAEIHHAFAREQMEPGYGSIVGGGANACVLHYIENNAKLNDGDLLLIDAGGEYQGYTADITRTFPVNGRYSGEQRAIYELVLEAQLASIDASKPGKRHLEDVHMASVKTITRGLVDLGLLKGEVDALIEDGAYKAYFMHGTGHWIGMDVHDVGNYYPASEGGRSRRLEPGMAMTIEPGIYVAAGSKGADERFWNIGVRIEDDIVITDGEPLILTREVPKAVDEIEALMAA